MVGCWEKVIGREKLRRAQRISQARGLRPDFQGRCFSSSTSPSWQIERIIFESVEVGFSLHRRKWRSCELEHDPTKTKRGENFDKYSEQIVGKDPREHENYKRGDFPATIFEDNKTLRFHCHQARAPVLNMLLSVGLET